MRGTKYLVALGLSFVPVAVFASSEGGLGNLISIAPGSMLWTLLTFFILLIVLWKFAWGPIIKGLEAREEKIQGAIDQAQRDRKEAARLLREYEEKLKAASAEISDRINKADQDAAARIEQASLEARDKAEKLLDRAKEEIAAERERTAAELRKEVAQIAASIAEKAIQESFTREDHLRIIQRKVEQMENPS